jgi:hypothetical protein
MVLDIDLGSQHWSLRVLFPRLLAPAKKLRGD